MRYLVAVFFSLALVIVGCQPNGPTPDEPANSTVEGQVFIRTQGGTSIELGGVDVMAVDSAVFRQTIARVDSLVQTKVDSAAPMLADRLREMEATNFEGITEKYDAQNKLEKEFIAVGQYNTPGYYLSQLPSAVDTSRTDASGRYQMRLPAREKLFLVARTSRSIGDDVERYHWAIPTVVQPGDTTQVLLDNSNWGYLIENDIALSKRSVETKSWLRVQYASGQLSRDNASFGDTWEAIARGALTISDSLQTQ